MRVLYSELSLDLPPPGPESTSKIPRPSRDWGVDRSRVVIGTHRSLVLLLTQSSTPELRFHPLDGGFVPRPGRFEITVTGLSATEGTPRSREVTAGVETEKDPGTTRPFTFVPSERILVVPGPKSHFPSLLSFFPY